MQSKTTVYAYLRVSTGQQVDSGIGIEVQQRSIRGYCMMQGWPGAAEFTEAGVSGSVPFSDRPEGKRLLAHLTAGDVVVAAKLDRMFRSAADALDMLALFKRTGVSLHLLDLGGDLMNGMGKFMFTILAAVAEQERDRIRERIVGAKASQKAKGAFLGGTVPSGYKVVDGMLVEDLEQMAMVRKVIEWRAEGWSLRKIKDRTRTKLSLSAIARICREAQAA